MITFSIALVALLLGYLLYGAFVERIFGVQPECEIVSYTLNVGWDFVLLLTCRARFF